MPSLRRFPTVRKPQLPNELKRTIQISLFWIASLLLYFAPNAVQAQQTDSLLIDTIDNHPVVVLAEFCINPICTEFVQPYIIQYTKNDHQQIKYVIQCGKQTLPAIEAVLREEEVPDELKYIAFIESHFNNHITSRSGAKGLWQFIRPTAVGCGLKVNNKIDERTNTVKSTRAAARYFKRLYNNYHDWLLVIAAYNCGDGAVNSYINKAGTSNFWDVYKYLPRQTKQYIAHYLGILNVMNAYRANMAIQDYLDFQMHVKRDTTLVAYTNVYATVKVDTGKQKQPMPTATVPEQTPKANSTDSKATNEITGKDYFIYVIKKGDTLIGISKRYPKNSPASIRSTNNIVKDTQLQLGTTILLEK